jgi:Tol biopolymer transport system component
MSIAKRNLKKNKRSLAMNIEVASRRHSIFVWASLLLLFMLLLATCGSPSASGPGTPTPGPTGTPITGTTTPPVETSTTNPLPPTQAGCPPTGTARSAVIASLALGSHANVVYVQNQMQAGTPIPGTLKRYDISTKVETIIVKLPKTSINSAQVSADGQWVLFVASVANRSAIQLIRMDGQGLQTLYCGQNADPRGISALQWSPDQKYIAFLENQNVYLLNVATGAYRIVVSGNNNLSYVPRTWLDNTRLYLYAMRMGTESPPLKLYLLDITSAKVQQALNSPTLCGDFDSSIDGATLFTSKCVFAMPMTGGPSVIEAQPATGGPASTIFSTSAYGITYLRMVSHLTLLFVIHNTGVGNIDISHNGLWKINIDGSGLTRLTSEAANETTFFNTYTQYYWSTVSRDGAYYAVKIVKDSNSPDLPTALLIGSMSGGAPFTLASGTANTDEVDIAGWTTM